jgi:hypothetical protein
MIDELQLDVVICDRQLCQACHSIVYSSLLSVTSCGAKAQSFFLHLMFTGLVSCPVSASDLYACE